jgi:hypothetical protein
MAVFAGSVAVGTFVEGMGLSEVAWGAHPFTNPLTPMAPNPKIDLLRNFLRVMFFIVLILS